MNSWPPAAAGCRSWQLRTGAEVVVVGVVVLVQARRAEYDATLPADLVRRLCAAEARVIAAGWLGPGPLFVRLVFHPVIASPLTLIPLLFVV